MSFRTALLALALALALASPCSATSEPQLITNYTATVGECITEAQHEVVVVMYLITYKSKYPDGPVARLLDKLIAAKKRGLRVTVLLDKNSDYRNTGKEDLKNQAAFDYLKRGGIDVRWDSLKKTTHSKVVVIDKRWVVIGSTNWSYAALSKNHETSLLIDSAQLAATTLAHLGR